MEGAIARLCAGERAAAPNPRFDATGYVCTLAATIRDPPPPSKHRRFLRPIGLLGIAAAAEALAAPSAPAGPRLGLFSGVGGLRSYERRRRMSP